MRNFLFLWSLFCWFPLKALAQGDDNLMLQYNQGPTNESLYYPWNVSVIGLGVRMNTPLDFSRPRLTWGAGLNVEYKISQSFGVATGASYLNIHYRYTRVDLNSKDFLAYWRIPLLVHISPNKKIRIAFGPSYNLLDRAYNSDIVHYTVESRPPFIITTGQYQYAEGHFKNAFGLLGSISYRFWKSFSARLEYTQIKTTDDPFTDQSNTFRGVNLGLEWRLFNPSKPTQYAIR